MTLGFLLLWILIRASSEGALILKANLWKLLIVVNLMVLMGCGAASPPDLATMIEQVKGGVVRIETFNGSGSGMIFDTTSEDGALVLTNYHVVEDAGRIDVEVDDSTNYRGYIQWFDADIDLAVVRICCGDFQTLTFGDVSQIKPGSEVIVIGYPLGLPGTATVTRGIVSSDTSRRGVRSYPDGCADKSRQQWRPASFAVRGSVRHKHLLNRGYGRIGFCPVRKAGTSDSPGIPGRAQFCRRRHA